MQSNLARYKIHYLHIRDYKDGKLDNRGGVTCGYLLYDDGIDKYDVCYSFSFCNDRDNYCKKIGRDIVAGRLLSDEYYTISALDLGYFDLLDYLVKRGRTLKGLIKNA